MCGQLLLQFKCTDRFETCHCLQIIQMRKWFIYNIQSHNIDFSYFFSRDYRLLPMSHDIDCWLCAWAFYMILKIILLLFYVLHLNTSLNLHIISM